MEQETDSAGRDLRSANVRTDRARHWKITDLQTTQRRSNLTGRAFHVSIFASEARAMVPGKPLAKVAQAFETQANDFGPVAL